MNISYSLFTNEIAKLFDFEFENDDHVINMPFLKDACVSHKFYRTGEMFITKDNGVKEPIGIEHELFRRTRKNQRIDPQSLSLY